MKIEQALFPIGGHPVVPSFTNSGQFSLCWTLSFVNLTTVSTVQTPQFPPFSLGAGSKECFSPALPKQPCISPSASAVFWATATGCSIQPSPGRGWPRALPSDSILGTAIIAGFTYFSLSVVSLTLRAFVSPKASSCSLFPSELNGKDR